MSSFQAAVTNSSAAAGWYWPNPGTQDRVALHNVVRKVEKLTCCLNTPGAFGPCCDTSHPDLCLCEDINTQQDFLNCLGEKTFLAYSD